MTPVVVLLATVAVGVGPAKNLYDGFDVIGKFVSVAAAAAAAELAAELPLLLLQSPCATERRPLSSSHTLGGTRA